MLKSMNMMGVGTMRAVRGGLWSICLFMVLVVSAQQVSAVGSWAPDAGDFGAGNDIYLVVSQAKATNTSTGGANGLDAQTSRVTIYSSVKSPVVTIAHPNQCKGGDPDTTNNPYSALNLQYTTEFRFDWSGGARQPAGSKDPDNDNWGRNYVANAGAGECTAGNNSWATTLNLPESAAQTIDGVKYYVVHLTAKMRDDVSHGSVNAFKVHTSSGVVSFNSSSGKKFALQDRKDGAGNEYSTFHLYFAMPCGADTQDKTFEWFDADQGSSNQPAQISYELWRRPRGTNDAWQLQAGPVTALGGNNANGSKSHKIYKGYEYDWRWKNVAKANGIQFEIPFNSIYSLVACKEDALVTPSVSLSPASAVGSGDVITAGAKFKNAADVTARVKYTRQFWKGNGTNGFSVAEGDVLVHSAVTDTVNIPPADLVLPNWTAAADGNYAYMCTALINIEAVDTATVNTKLAANSAGPICVPIAKHPALKVMNGDMRSGGTFAATSQSVCKLPVGDPSVYASNQSKYLRQFDITGHDYVADGMAKGSYGQNAILTPGVISSFGSHNTFYQGPTTSSASLLFGSRRSQSPMWTYEGYFYGANATTNTKGHCLIAPKNLPTTPAFDINNRTISAADTGYYNFGNNKNDTLTIQGASFGPNGGRHIIRVTQSDIARTQAERNKVVITGNITISNGPYASIAVMPQFMLVIEKDIKLVVANGVSNVDGTIVTRGDVFTCAGAGNTGFNGTGTLTTQGSCSGSLTFNGAVVVGDKLYPYRTAGFSTVSDQTPAELFNLRSDTLLSDYARSQTSMRLRTTFQRELPPRF